MQTLQLTITLPDIVQFDDRDILRMQLLFVKSLVDGGRINFNDPAQRDAVLEWYLKIVSHVQPTAAESREVKAAFWREIGWPELTERTADEIVENIDAEIDRLTTKNGWTAATFEQWGREHLRMPNKRS
jgi:hypothetical protein